MAQGMRPVAIGIMTGVVTAAIGARMIATMLYSVTPTDLTTYSAVLAAMAVSATLACLLPARRATKVEPAVALRS
jgi:putative ABC transport system permease protein